MSVFIASLVLTTTVAQPQALTAASSPSASADKAAMAAVRLIYRHIGAYEIPYQLVLENTGMRAVLVTIRTPNYSEPFKPYVDRFAVDPGQFQSVRYVRFQGSSQLISAEFVDVD